MTQKSLVTGIGLIVVFLIGMVVYINKPLSPKEHSEMHIDNLHIRVEYSSPAVRKRVIWGGLLPYDVLWRAGANDATVFHFNQDVQINNTVIPEGTYSFFAIPREKTWTLIFNKDWDLFGTSRYNADHDVVRFDVKPENLKEHHERLRYDIDSKGIVSLKWEKKCVRFQVDKVK